MLNSTLGSIAASKHNSGYLMKDRELELPNVQPILTKINKTINRSKLRSSSSSSHSQLMREKVQWLTRNAPYESMTEQEINQQYRRLRDTLKDLNEEIARVLQRAQFQTIKSPEKEQPPQHTYEVRSRQVQNNKKMIGFYRLELAKLQKRVGDLGEDSKELIEKDIRITRDAIAATRLAIKELRKKNSSLGNSIIDSDGIVREMRNLEQEKIQAESKRCKMAQDLEKVLRDIEDYRTKSEVVTDQYQQADQVLKQLDQKDITELAFKRTEMTAVTKKMQLQTTKKKFETGKAQGEQRYLAKLKQLENSVVSLNKVGSKINQTDKDIIEAKRIVKELEEKIRTGTHSAEDGQDSDTLFLTKPLDLSSYHSPSPITGDTGGRELDKVSDYNNQPFDEMAQTNRDTLTEVSRGATVPVVKTETRQLSSVLEQGPAFHKSAQKATHQIQIGTDEYIADEIQPLQDDLLQQKFPQSHNQPPPPDNIEQKKRKLLQKLRSFQAEDSTD